MLVRPRSGSGWSLSEPTLRGESKRHYASLRLVVERGDVRVRLKESLNDWWVPVANDINLRRVESYTLVGEEVVSLGRDYHGASGACAQVLGTTVEAYVQHGSLDPTGWSELFAALEAAVPEAVAEARRTSFAERNYWTRWGRDVGPWDSHEFTKPRWMRPDPHTFAEVAWASTPDRWAPMPGAPDSIAARTHSGSREMQVLFRQPMTLNYTSWRRIVTPPEPEGPVASRDPRYPKLSKTAEVADRSVRYAGLSENVGAWFFHWVEEDREHELHLRAKKGLDERQALRTLSSILA